MRRRTWIAVWLAAALVLAAVAGWGLLQVSRARCFVLTGHTVCRVETTQPLVALTFDDGPTRLGLDAILPELARHHAHATFFLIGAEAQKHPEMVQALLAAGQEVGDHSWSHVRMVGHGSGFYDAEIARTNAALRAGGATPTLFRPPYGKKLIGLPRAVERAGMTMVTWDVEDPPTKDPVAFAREVVAQARPGSIILIHAMYSSNGTARAALPTILDGLAAKGLRVVSVGELRAAASPSPPTRSAGGEE